MTEESLIMVLGVLSGAIAAAPFWITVIRSQKVGSWFRANTMAAGLLSQGINVAVMISVIIACFIIARPSLLRFTVAANVSMISLVLSGALFFILNKRRTTEDW
ncbi:MAG: hypothetical protein LBG68_03435 [Coriobacteriales bacterium]|nr:hypothetical protein [Coriobacteriales bacterium]